MLSAAHTWSLTAVAVACGAAVLWALRRFSDQQRLQFVQRQMRAQLYALRLFTDDPRLVLRAQKQLLKWNARYLALLLRPTAVLLLPMVLLLAGLDAIYGYRPLRPGESTIVTAQFAPGTDLLALAPSLEGRHMAIDTPVVRLAGASQACWRIRALTAGAGGVILHARAIVAAKRVRAGTGLSYLSARRSAALIDWLRHPGESRLSSASLRWIEVAYPRAAIGIFGWRVPWLAWFCMVSLLAMLALRKPFGVSL
jgi:hypothetical protein